MTDHRDRDASGARPGTGPLKRDGATTSGAPYPPGDTQGDGPARRVPAVPSAPLSAQEPQDTENDPGHDVPEQTEAGDDHA